MGHKYGRKAQSDTVARIWNMAYHESMYFLVFLPVVLIGYQLAPKRVRFGVLLFFSYCFYFLFSHRLILFLAGATGITYIVGRLAATAWYLILHAFCNRLHGGCVLEED